MYTPDAKPCICKRKPSIFMVDKNKWYATCFFCNEATEYVGSRHEAVIAWNKLVRKQWKRYFS